MRWVRRGLYALIGMIALAALLIFVADTQAGHRYIIRQIEAQRPQSGLVIGIDRIEGSIYGKARIIGLSLDDPKGRFLYVPSAALDWRPLAWPRNLLDIHSLHASEARLLRVPALRPGAKDAPILPGFDIEIGSLKIDRLLIAKGVAGEAREGRVAGKASIRKGRALIDLKAFAGKGDELALLLDAEPDRDRFDLDAQLTASAGGVFGALAGTARPLALSIKGDGRWRDWAGKALLDVSGARTVDLTLKAKEGQFGLSGQVQAGALTKGRLQQLTAPMIRVSGSARLADRRLTGQIDASSAALTARGKGMLNLATNSFSAVLVDAQLRQPAALLPSLGGSGIALKMRLNGPFSEARFEYLLTAPRLTVDQTGFDDIQASGQGRFSPAPVQVPVKLSARRVTGVGDVAGGILSNLKAEGVLLVTTKTITGDGILVRSDKFDGRISVLVDLATGLYDVGLLGKISSIHIPGLGIVDVKADLKVVPAGPGQGARIAGRGQAWVRKWENDFLAGLAGGLPVIETDLTRGADGALIFTNARLKAPALTLSGQGVRRRDGSFHIEGSGTQRQYGPFTLKLDGRIERPKLEIVLARPVAALGLANVTLQLDPLSSGYGWQAQGQSMLGPFTGQGSISLPRGGPVVIDIERLAVSGMVARGQIEPRGGALAGRVALAGGGVDGVLTLSPQRGLQLIDANVKARNARFEGPPAIAIRRGAFDGTLLLDPAGVKIDGTLSAEGLARGNWQLARLAANLKMTGEDGEIRASFAGARGRSFDIQTVARGRRGVWQIDGQGSVDRRPIRLMQTATLKREGGGWRLDPVDLSFAGGKARIGGLFGGESTALQAQLTGMPLNIADLVSPGLGLGGIANGSLDYRFTKGGAPEGKADLRIKGLTRAGLVLSSAPVDMGVNAQLNATSAAIRAIAVSNGREIGRAQARLTPGPGANVFARLSRAPLFAQVRYSGAADVLWRLTGVEVIDISGGVAVAADVTGTVDDPQIRGSLRTTNARVESPLTGMVLTQVKASGRFGGGSKLVIDAMSALTPGNGSLSASGSIDLSSARGFAMDLAIDAKNARLFERDELGATVTGPLRLKSEGGQGLISGDLVLNKSRYTLGRTTAVAAIPRLKVTELNKPDADLTPVQIAQPWQLAVNLRAPDRLAVTGMGLDSEWSARLAVTGTPYAPIINGRADMERGGYEFAGKRFELKRGVIRFQGESPPDPILDIAAEGTAQGLTATVRVTGTGLKPDIRFTSVPSLPEDELLSRLLFGTSIANLSAPEALQLATGVASLRSGGDGLSPLNALRKAVGLDRLRLLPADSTTGMGMAVSAGKYITRRAYVEVVTDGQGYSATRAEFQVTRWLAILSSISSIGRQSAAVRVSKDY